MHSDRADSIRDLESNLRSDSRLRIWIAVLLVLFALNGVVTIYNHRRFTTETGQLAHTHEVLTDLNALWIKLLAAESGQRAFVITGDASYATEMNDAREEIAKHTSALERLVADNAGQLTRLADLKDAAEARLARMEHVRSMRERYGLEGAMQGVGTGRELMSRVRAVADAMRTHELELLDMRTKRSNQILAIGSISAIGEALVGLCVLILFSRALRHHLMARRRATELLYVERERFRTTLASIGDGVITTDTVGRVVFLNEVAQQLTGYTLDEARGRDLTSIFTIVNEDSRATVDNPALRALREGAIVGLANHTILIAKDGSERAIDDSAAPIRNEAQAVTGSVLVFRDVTARRDVERQLDERTRVMRMRIQISDLLAGNVDLATGLACCTEACVRTLDAEFSRIWLADEANQLLELKASTGKDLTTVAEIDRMRFGVTRVGQVASTRVPYYTNDAAADSELTSHDWSSSEIARAVAIHPLDIEGRTLGVLGIWSNHPFSKALFDELDLISNTIAQFIARKQVDSARQRLAELVENSNDPITVFSDDGTLDFVNRAGRIAFFAAEDEAVLRGLPIRELFVAEDRGTFESIHLPAIANDGGSEFELRMQHRRAQTNGACDPTTESRWMNCHAFEMVDSSGARTGIGMVCRDVSERRRSEQSVKESQEQYRQLAAELQTTNQRLEREMNDRVEAGRKLEKRSYQLQSIAEIATRLHAVNDVQSVLTMITEAARRIVDAHVGIGVKLDPHAEAPPIVVASVSSKYEVQGARPDALIVSHAQQIVLGTKRALRVSKDEIARDSRWRNATEEDTQLDGDLLIAPLTGFDGSVFGALHLVDKASGTFTIDDEAILVQIALMGSIAIENSRLYDELFEADQRKDEFLATLAHELRNPLAPIRNGLEILQRAKGDPSAFEQIRQMMERQIHMMIRLVDDLLDVSRITRGKVVLQRERLDVAAAVHDAIDTSRPIIDAASHRLIVELPVRPMYVHADRVRIAQVVANLLNNAAKFTPDGGTIRLSAEQEGAFAVIRVRDDGVGIEPEMLPRIFEIFTQADQTIQRTKTGIGIGLALAKKMVELHGGSVEARSEGVGKGSDLIVRLPLANDVHATRPIETAPLLEPKANSMRVHRILVVDDHRDSAESLTTLLRLMGHDVRTSLTAHEALATAREFVPNLFFLDIGLPDMNGYELAKALRGMSEFRTAFLVAQTGWGQDADRRRSSESGFDAHLVKPIDVDLLKQILGGL